VSCDLTCASIAKTDAKELRGRNFVPTAVKSEGIDASCDTTTVSCDETDGTCEETFAISGETVVMPAEVKGEIE
jgi:hypothetical protein